MDDILAVPPGAKPVHIRVPMNARETELTLRLSIATDALAKLIPRLVRCSIARGSDPEFAEASVRSAREALARARGELV